MNDTIEVTPGGGMHTKLDVRCDLLPPKAQLLKAEVLKTGAEKYAVDNWRLIDRRAHINHALTHILKWLSGDTSEAHLTHAACRLDFSLETE